jgi:hypothetical protein
VAEHTPPSAAELADRLRTMAAKFPTIESIVAECRRLDIKGDPGCSESCLVARLIEHHCEFTPSVCAAERDEVYEAAEIHVGQLAVELPPLWSELIDRFDRHEYPDLEY